MDMLPVDAIALIEKAYREKADFLDLGNCGLVQIPPEIKVLAPFLKILNLGSRYHTPNGFVNTGNKGFRNDFTQGTASFSHLSDLSHLTTLHLKSVHFKQDLLKELRVFRIIDSLDISSNQITDTGANALTMFLQLRYLDVSSNMIADTGIAALMQLEDLTSLDISFNYTTNDGITAIDKLTKLTRLHVIASKITDSGAAKIATLTNLTHLSINSNQLTQAGATTLAKLIKLSYLNICDNRISDKGATAIGKLKDLTYLDVGYNHIMDQGMEAITKLSQLVILHARSNYITDAGINAIDTLTQLTALDLHKNGITDAGVKTIGNLGCLTSLNISANRLTSIGAIAKLNKLRTLYVNANEITDLGLTGLSKLGQLTTLAIHSNKITDNGVCEIAMLQQLSVLDIHSNRLSSRGATEIGRLTQLTNLDIHRNAVMDTGAAAIARLEKLNTLNISNNEITEKGVRVLIHGLPDLISFSFQDYSITGIPEEIGTGVAALKDYFRPAELVDNTLVKVILIGNSTAGKSSLADFLVNRNYEQERESTHGIKLWRWQIEGQDRNIRVNIWDFGGQDYFHATHNLFLDDKSLYLLMHTSKEVHDKANQQSPYMGESYWLGNARSRWKKEMPIWVIQSKADINPYAHIAIDPALQKQFNVDNCFRLSVKNAHGSMKGNGEITDRDFNYFLDCLMSELKKLMIDKLPPDWIEIRDKHLPVWRNEALILSKKEFNQRCRLALEGTRFNKYDPEYRWDGLLKYLKGCGEVIYFERNRELHDKIFLSAENLADNIYSTLLSKQTLVNRGCINTCEFEGDNAAISATYLQVLKAYQLVFQKPGEPGIYIAPQYLPESPMVALANHIKLSYVVRFPNYMPGSLISRFMVKYASKTNDNHYWRYGAYFDLYDIRVFVKFDIDLLKISIHIDSGERSNRCRIMKELLLFLTLPGRTYYWSDDDDVFSTRSYYHHGIDDIDLVSGEIELSLNDKDFSTIDNMRHALKNGVTSIKSDQGNYIELNEVIQQLLIDNKRISKRIFFSYSHKDEVYKKELDTHFSALKRSGKVETWQDGAITPGKLWDIEIKTALAAADIVLLLLSPDFMASEYIWEVEIKAAKESGAIIVPIFLRPCDFEETFYHIHAIQGLPRGKNGAFWWIASDKFSSRDEGYLEVVQGIKNTLLG